MAGYGLGGAGAVVAAILGGLATIERNRFFEDPNEASRERLDRANGFALAADALGIASAVVLAGTIIYHLATIPKESSADVRFER